MSGWNEVGGGRVLAALGEMKTSLSVVDASNDEPPVTYIDS